MSRYEVPSSGTFNSLERRTSCIERRLPSSTNWSLWAAAHTRWLPIPGRSKSSRITTRKAPSDLTGEDAHDYLCHLYRVQKVSGSVYHTHVWALRFLYKEVLELTPDFGKIPKHKKGKTLPVVLRLISMRPEASSWL